MKTIKECIGEEYIGSDDSYIIEGINIDAAHKRVSLTDDHNHGVDFTLVNNPVYDKVDGYDVISIFKRTKIGEKPELDGNPFIYALKGIKGWTMDITRSEVRKYVKRFCDVCSKIGGSYDTIIMVPSRSQMNRIFMKEIARNLKCENTITDYFTKIDLEDLVTGDYIDRAQLQVDYGADWEDKFNTIYRCLGHMGDHFEAKEIRPKELLKYVKYISQKDGADIRSLVDGKNVLILDDIVSSGQTISQCAKNVLSNFVPKSLTVITLLSRVK